MDLDFIQIELNTGEVESFKLFRQYQNDFEEMLKAGVFHFKDGSAIIHRDTNGILKNIEIKTQTFIRRKRLDKVA